MYILSELVQFFSYKKKQLKEDSTYSSNDSYREREYMKQEEAVETIMKLGLTVLQAKVYLALAKSGPATGRMAASAAKIASNDVYRVLGELQEKGLAEKILANPTMYKVTPSDGLSTLLNKKKEEYFETQKQVKALSHLLREHETDNPAFESSQQFVMTSQVKLLFKLHHKLAANTKRSVDFLCPIKISGKALLDIEYIQPAIKRDVKIRVITPIAELSFQNNNYRKTELFEERSLPKLALSFGMIIFDEQQLTVALSKEVTPSLWTSNPNMVSIANAYFNSIWESAKPYKQIIEQMNYPKG